MMTTYETAVQASYEQPVVVLFTATWCGPCKTTKPLLQQLQANEGFALAMLDADQNREIMTAKGIRSVPTMLVLRAGQVIGSFSGGRTEAQLREALTTAGVLAAPKSDFFGDFETVYGAGGVGEHKR